MHALAGLAVANLRPGERGRPARRAVLILAFPHKGLIRVGFALKFGYAKAALARVTPILAFPHKGGRDLSLAICT